MDSSSLRHKVHLLASEVIIEAIEVNIFTPKIEVSKT